MSITKNQVDQSIFLVVADRNNNTSKLVASPSNFQVGLKDSPSDLTAMGKLSARRELCLSTDTYRNNSTISKDVCVALVYGGGNISLPTGMSAGHYLCVKDADGSASSNNIVLSDPRGGLVDGSSTTNINTNYGSKILCWNNEWFVISST